ncbi:hypothetical protein Pan216_01860 [Planctomycetes bacterium Pan216]|uniref:Cytochrome c domain-containing protein n=1 Tax=Kolteria novifilia TaxID=2527975 RepID=A0A518AXA2_9BACT|nr:hypothetical protein Pan216_01860 [Planctomycetes bacterium Pan216]
MLRDRTRLLLGLIVCGCLSTPAHAQIQFGREPIRYGTAPVNDAVTRIQKSLDSGETTLAYDEKLGYLPAILDELAIDSSSQVLVYSKTSFQLRRITPSRPRALYFNEDSYVGWVRGGDVIEVMATDPEQGEIFYTFPQKRMAKPRFVRDDGRCIVCHASSKTQGVPGGLVRSMFVDDRGQPHYAAGTFTTDHTSPFSERWGGWYVTGTHGQMRHMGNIVATDDEKPEEIDLDPGANLADLSAKLDVEPYLTPHSDIVALMVLEHQTQMQNYLTLANYECRMAQHHDQVMNEALDRPKEHQSDSTKRRIASVGEKVLRSLLFVDEFPLTSPVKGTSGFAEWFQARGKRDEQGRSLRDMDLKTRMFKFPCSYMIYSASFDQLPSAVKRHVVDHLHEVLAGNDQRAEFAHLSQDDRKAILEILTETKPDLWKQGSPKRDEKDDPKSR